MFKKLITLTLATALLTSSLSFVSVHAATPQDTINENLEKYQTLDNQILELNSKIEDLDVEIDKTTIKLNENNKIDKIIQAIPKIENCLKIYDTLTTEEKNKLLKTIINKAYYLKNKAGNRWDKDTQDKFTLELELFL